MNYTVVDLFCGAGGLSLGFEKAGFEHLLLVDNNKDCCATIDRNRDWKIKNIDLSMDFFTSCDLHFKLFCGNPDVVIGSPPCQSFSQAGNKKGLDDNRGKLIFSFIKAVEIIQPKIFVLENVPQLLRHLHSFIPKIVNAGYLIRSTILNANHFGVPQQRKRLFIVGFRKDMEAYFMWPKVAPIFYMLHDALKKGALYDCDVPKSIGSVYDSWKSSTLCQIPPGGCWRNLDPDWAQEYMGADFYNGGGKTGIARRLYWYAPCPTLTCNPSQKRTERCHPDETRPLTVREYARIQTFPDDWEFCGSLSSQYRQIGNAVPVNLAYHVALSVKAALEKI